MTNTAGGMNGGKSDSGPVVQAEVERKYDVDESTTLPAFDGLEHLGVDSSRTVGVFELEAEYFDTARGDLAAHRITLRRRQGGTDDGWHIKLPATEGRTELHWPLDTGAHGREAPEVVLEPVRGLVRDRSVGIVARIATRRSIIRCYGADGVELVEIADDLVTASDVSNGTVRVWREWEAELGVAAPQSSRQRTALLDTIEERLLAAGARPAASASKLATALGRTGLGGEERDPEVNRESAASTVLMIAVRGLVRDIVATDALVRRGAEDSVHHMRTRLRRLRSLLTTYRAVFGDTAELRHGLKWIGGVLGEARDVEVARARALTAIDARDPAPLERSFGEGSLAEWSAVRRSITESAAADEKRAMATIRRALSSERYFRLLDVLEEFAAAPPLGPEAASAVSEVAVAALRTAARRVVRRAKRAAAADDHDDRVALLHETRKAAKRLRYAAEAVGSGASAVFGTRVRRLGTAAETVHNLLGEHRDGQLLRHRLRATADASGHAFEYGVLHEAERQRGRELLADYRTSLGPLRKRASRI